MIQRRSLLQSLMAVVAWRWPRRAAAQPAVGAMQRPQLLALAAVVLPQELGDDGRRSAVDQFVRWVADYKAGAERDHGYGVTSLRTTAPLPATNYAAQLDALDRAAGGSLATATPAERQRVVTAAITAAGVKELPGRPTGAHVATDLMGHYFNSPGANDLAYRRAIGRDACRPLVGSDARPSVLAPAERA